MKPPLQLGRPVQPEEEPLLSAAEREGFHADGFLALEALLEPAEIARLRALVDALLRRPEPEADGMRFDYLAASRAGADAEGPPRLLQQLLPFDYEPALFDTALFHRGARLARDLLGAPLFYRGSHYMEKPGGGGAATPWHQDEAFWEPAHRHEAIAIWVPLHGVLPDGGCMEFVRGSHLAEALAPHRRVGGDPAVHGLELDGVAIDPSRVVRCPLPVGGATVHHCRVIHGSGVNRAAAARPALVLNFETTPTPLDPPRAVPWQATESELAARRAERGISLP